LQQHLDRITIDILNVAVKTVQEQKQLITQLEEDLHSVNALSSMFRGAPEGQNMLPSGGEAEMVAEVVKDFAH
jgi:homeobox protein cut-like